MAFVPDKFQKRIGEEFTDTDNNIVVQAVAGSGKTTTILHLINFIPHDQDAIYLAFNKHVVESIKAKVKAKPNLTISTLNGFGARMLYKAFGSISLVENKYFLIALKLFKAKWKLKENKWSYCYTVSKIVDVMRFNFCFDDDQAIVDACNEYGVFMIGDELVHAREVFDIGVENVNQIDFIDQLFMPVIRKIRVNKFNVVLADEIQDFSKLQHQFIKKLIKPITGRLVGVGDKFQSIYHFSGASSNSFDAFKNLLPNTVELPLSYCYRCGYKIVERAKKLVPQIEAAPFAKPGAIIESVRLRVHHINEGHAVVCRTTKPLVLLCRELIRMGRKATIKGREIGENLLALIRKTKASTIQGCLDKIQDYKEELRIKLLKKGTYMPDSHQSMLQLIEKQEVIRILSEMVSTIPQLIRKVKEIFVESPDEGVMLMTIHKSKGLEFNVVWHLNHFLIPSPYARTQEQRQQEENLDYVSITRAKSFLYYLNIFEDEDGNIFFEN